MVKVGPSLDHNITSPQYCHYSRYHHCFWEALIVEPVINNTGHLTEAKSTFKIFTVWYLCKSATHLESWPHSHSFPISPVPSTTNKQAAVFHLRDSSSLDSPVFSSSEYFPERKHIVSSANTIPVDFKITGPFFRSSGSSCVLYATRLFTLQELILDCFCKATAPSRSVSGPTSSTALLHKHESKLLTKWQDSSLDLYWLQEAVCHTVVTSLNTS